MKKAEKKKNKEFDNPYTVIGALKNGSMVTKLTALIMGLGNFAHKQIGKGLMYLVVEIGWLIYMIQYGFHSLYMLPSLGWREQVKVWNEAKSIYEYQAGDQSSLIL